jgi:DNA-binding winged helix-turn-helix (wHTH) protein
MGRKLFYEFKPFWMTVSGVDLERDGQRIATLTVTGAKLLQVLLKHAPNTISKDMLISEAWDANTSDNNLTFYIHKLRRILDEPRTPIHESWILTVPGYGYAFRKAVRIVDRLGNPDPHPDVPPNTECRRNTGEQIQTTEMERLPDRVKIAAIQSGMMDDLGKVYLGQHGENRCDNRICALVVKARCLLAPGEPEAELPDLVQYRSEFRTLTKPVVWRRITVTANESLDSMTTPTCSLVNLKSGKMITTIPIPMRSSSNSELWEWLVFFDPVLPPQSGPYRLVFQHHVPGFMKPLKDTGRDELSFTLRRVAPTATSTQVDFILVFPSSYPAIRMQRQKPGSSGRKMTEHELLRYEPPPPNFQSIGWTAKRLSKNGIYAVGLYRT